MPDPVQVRLRAARPSDCERVWQINNESSAREASRSTDPIPLRDHVHWFNLRLTDPATLLDMVEVEAGRAVGVVRLEWAGGAAELSVAIDPAERGRGVGGAAVRAATAEAAARWPGLPLEAWVAESNRASIKVFEAAGFIVAGRRPIGRRWFRRYRHHPGGDPQ